MTINAMTTNPTAADLPYQRTIKSFVIRAGRLTTGQAKAYATFGADFLIPYTPEPLNFEAAFGRAAPTILEIGFGMGEATAHIATVRPSDNFLCCEVHEPGVGALLKRVGEGVKNVAGLALSNIRIIQHDAVEVLDNMLPESSLDGVHIFFPDPWHKARHNKRRLIQAPFVQKLVSRLKVGGYLHCATDWQNYAEQILDILSAETGLKNTSTDTSGYAQKPDYRPLTKFENRGIKLGHGVWDVVFQKN
jgi:tRNA (guanine-N7-)-methyltransferase